MEALKIEELRIGNIVNDEDGTPMYIAGLWTVKDGWTYIDSAGNTGPSRYLSGIPLTEEWLIRFGFQNKQATTYPGWFSENTNGYSLRVHKSIFSDNGKFYFSLNSMKEIDILYVHQLQNIYFALTGQELTIKP